MEISGLPRGFSTCCLRFTNDVATTHAKLASGRLARLCREGVEPSGPLQKVSDHILVPLFWIYPGAMEVSSRHPFRSAQRAHPYNMRSGDFISGGMCRRYPERAHT